MALSQQLLDEAVKAHGHLGPFLVIGLRMGLLGKRLCKGDAPECQVAVISQKPPLCAVDGIRTALGRTTLSVRAGSGVCAVFTATTGESVALRLKTGVLKRYRSVPWDKCDEAAAEVLRSSDEDIFERISKPCSRGSSPSD